MLSSQPIRSALPVPQRPPDPSPKAYRSSIPRPVPHSSSPLRNVNYPPPSPNLSKYDTKLPGSPTIAPMSSPRLLGRSPTLSFRNARSPSPFRLETRSPSPSRALRTRSPSPAGWLETIPEDRREPGFGVVAAGLGAEPLPEEEVRGRPSVVELGVIIEEDAAEDEERDDDDEKEKDN